MASARVRRFGQRTEVRTGLVGLLLGIALLVAPAFAGQGEQGEPPDTKVRDELQSEFERAAWLVDRNEAGAALGLLEELQSTLSSRPREEQVYFGYWAAELKGRAFLSDGRPDAAAKILSRAIDLVREQDWEELNKAWHATIETTIVNLMIASAEHRLAIGEHGQAIEELEPLLPEDDEEEEQDGPRSLRVLPIQQGTIDLVLGAAHGTLAVADENHIGDARHYLSRARDNLALDDRTRFGAAARAALLELDLEEFEAARDELETAGDLLLEFESSTTEPAFFLALQARLDRLDGEPRFELESRRVELGESLSELCREWRALPRSPGKTASIRYDRERLVVEELLRLEHQLVGVEAALERLTEVQAAVLYQPLERRGERWLDEIREQLVPPGGGVLLYFPGTSKVHLFLIDAETVDRVELVSEDELRPLISTFDHALSTLPQERSSSDDETLDEQGAVLADLLLPEGVRESVDRWSALTIVATGRLWALHFRALPFAGARLGEKKAIGFLPSLTLGLTLARREEPRRGALEVLLLGAPPSPAGRPALEVRAREWKRLLRAYESDCCSLLVGREASAANLAAADLARIPVVQFLAHGDQDYTLERPWGVALADGVVRSGDVESLRDGPGGLVILSACGSGGGPLRVGAEEVTTIGGAFLWKGARDVVLSNADAMLEATLSLSGHLHDAISTGNSPAEALRRASEALIEEGDHAHPSHHSMVRVVGLAHRPYFEVRPLPESEWDWGRWPLFALVLVLAALGFGLVRRRQRSR